MFTRIDKKFARMEKVIYVAFACGCVHTIRTGKAMTMPRCPEHGDHQVSFTEELVQPQRPAA